MCREIHLLLQVQELELELGLDLGVLDLDTLEAVDTASDGRREGLNIARRLADETTELFLSKRKQRGVL